VSQTNAAKQQEILDPGQRWAEAERIVGMHLSAIAAPPGG
jgi:hypothetical protein